MFVLRTKNASSSAPCAVFTVTPHARPSKGLDDLTVFIIYFQVSGMGWGDVMNGKGGAAIFSGNHTAFQLQAY